MTGTENIIPLPSAEDIEAEAASWLTVLGREDVSLEDAVAFRQWLKQSERRREAFDALSALWGELAILKELDDIAEAALETPERRPRRAPAFVTRRRAVAAAASVAAIVAGAGAFQAYYAGGLNQSAAFETAVGAQRTVLLSDGSTLQMNTDSRVEVNFSPARRSLRLIRGEAHFAVVKNPRRPFFVHAANGVVEAVGTAFTVRLRSGDAVEVTVEEGRVSLTALDPPASAAPDVDGGQGRQKIAELTVGQSVVFNERVEHFAKMQESELNRKLAWRQGMLIYEGEALADVVADISRYTDIDIDITDPAIRSLPVAGYFRVGKIEALFDALEGTFDLKVEHVSKNHIRLSAAS